MEFKITRASEWRPKIQPCPEAVPKGFLGNEYCVTINTLEELIALVKSTGSSLVINEHSIIISDHYLE